MICWRTKCCKKTTPRGRKKVGKIAMKSLIIFRGTTKKIVHIAYSYYFFPSVCLLCTVCKISGCIEFLDYLCKWVLYDHTLRGTLSHNATCLIWWCISEWKISTIIFAKDDIWMPFAEPNSHCSEFKLQQCSINLKRSPWHCHSKVHNFIRSKTFN